MKRLYLHKIVRFDVKHQTSYVRWMEMIVDGALTNSAYSMQFWKDVETYGLDGAIAYFRKQPQYIKPGTLQGIERAAKLIAESIETGKPIEDYDISIDCGIN